MIRLALVRLALLVPLWWGVATAAFALVELAPGDPIDLYADPTLTQASRDALIRRYALDRPMGERYAAMMRRLVVLDLGESMSPGRRDRRVTALIGEALPHTLVLGGLTLLWVYPVGVGIGLLQAARRGAPVDVGLTAAVLVAWSAPEFVVAALARAWTPRGWPISGWVDPLDHDRMGMIAGLLDHAQHLVLPVGTLGLAWVAGVARYARVAALEVAGQDFVRTARAKGLSDHQVWWWHVLRASLPPIAVRFGTSLALLASGAVIVERIFALPGMGQLLVQAGFEQDVPVLVGCLCTFALAVVVGNLLADLAVYALDPRTRR